MASKDNDFSKGAGGLVAIIGDEDTVAGFLLTGIGCRDNRGLVNFLVVNSESTKHEEIAAAFRDFSTRDDIAIILITQSAAQEIRYLISAYERTIPTVLEIPSKEIAYKEDQDPIMQRVLRLLGSREN